MKEQLMEEGVNERSETVRVKRKRESLFSSYHWCRGSVSTDSHRRSQDSLPPTGSPSPSSEVTSSSPHTIICPLFTPFSFKSRRPTSYLSYAKCIRCAEAAKWTSISKVREPCYGNEAGRRGEKKTSNLPSTLPSCCKLYPTASPAQLPAYCSFLNLPPLSLILCVAIYWFNPLQERPP